MQGPGTKIVILSLWRIGAELPPFCGHFYRHFLPHEGLAARVRL